MQNAFFITLLIALSLPLSAQYQIGLVPRQSPDRTVSARIGYTEIKVEYGSPRVNGRDIWGELVPYDKVWRAGANNATRVSFDAPVKIAGQSIPAGTYAFFVLPRYQQKWTVIFSKNANQWGAFRYKEEEDALQVNVLPQQGAFQEDLRYSIEEQGFRYGRLELAWGRIRIPIEIETDYLEAFVREVESRTDSADKQIQWVVLVQGADHLLDLGEKLDLAMEWVNRSEKLAEQVTDWNPQFYPMDYIEGHRIWLKAELLARSGQYTEAVKLAKAMQTWKDKAYFYQRKEASEQIDDQIAAWEKKAE